MAELSDQDEPDEVSNATDTPIRDSNKRTAERAKTWLVNRHGEKGYRGVDASERIRIAQAFAAMNKVVYGQAFDLVRVVPGTPLDFSDLSAVTAHVRNGLVHLVEVKATRIARGDHFRGHFFSISTAELLVAQSLGTLFRFAFVDVMSEQCFEVSLQQIYARAKAIYPTWSIRLDEGDFPADTRL